MVCPCEFGEPGGVQHQVTGLAAAWPVRRGRSVVFIGRHEPRKGLEVLLQALPYLPADITLLVAGEGPATARLRHATAGDQRVCWLGRVSEADKQRLFATAGVLCAPSLDGESFGVVLLEAMAAGLPVLASRYIELFHLAVAARQ
jgi:phosphatidylinositol alpha-mannosyltransferase